MLFLDKVILLTGDCGLLGSHLRNFFLDKGATVYGVDTDNNNVYAHKNYVKCRGDISQPEFINKLVKILKENHEALDVLINNAAINDSLENQSLTVEESKFENFPLDLWKKTLAVNLTGPFLLCQKLTNLMINSNNASIINIASTYGMVAPKQDLYMDKEGIQYFYKGPAYSVTKAGLIMFTKYLASYYGETNIRVNSISPGGIKNGQDDYFVQQYSSRTLLGRMAKPEDYEGIVEFLSSEKSRYLTGTNIPVDGGWTAV